MNAEAAKEMVLVVPRSDLDAICPHRFNTNVEQALSALIPKAHFRPRGEVEHDFSVKQIIPYVTVRYQDKFLRIRRTSKQTEARLHWRVGLGISGHINDQDGTGIQAILTAMRRELQEEITLNLEISHQLVGIINVNDTEVDRVHVGFVFATTCASPEFHINEEGHHDAAWATVEELKELEPQMETWAKVVFSNVMHPSAERMVTQLDELFTQFAPEIPKGMQVQVYLDEDGYSCVLQSEHGREEKKSLKQVWENAKNYERESKD